MSTPRKIKLKEIPLVKRAILEKRQGFKCVLCLRPLTVLSGCLDHDHTTGLVRGVLCRNCNGLEGKIRNLVNRARQGAPFVEYLDRVGRYWDLHSTDRTGLIYPTHLEPEQLIVKRKARAKVLRARRKAVK